MRMIHKPIAKQVLKKKSQLKIIETMKIELILRQVFFFFFPEKISQLNTYYVLEGKKDAL